MTRRKLIAALALLPALAACGRRGPLEPLPADDEKKREDQRKQGSR